MLKAPHEAMNNRELLESCLQSMALEAWREFVRRCEPVISGAVARVARRFGCFSPDLVLDLTQDVYFKLCREGFKLLRDLRIAHENSLFSYVKLVAISVAHDHFRKQRLDLNSEEFADDTSSRSVQQGAREATGEEKILLQEIEEIVEKITVGPNSERDRAVFWLHHREGFTTNAIATIPALKLTQKGVESVLHRIRISLRQQIEAKPKARRISTKE